MESRRYLFVYGSLKQGYSLHEYLQHEEYVGEFCTAPSYQLFDCGSYPGMVDAQHADGVAVQGEVYCVGLQTWPVLDEIEGVDQGLYCCRPVNLALWKQRFVVHSYFYLQSTSTLRQLGVCWPD